MGWHWKWGVYRLSQWLICELKGLKQELSSVATSTVSWQDK